MKLVVIIPAYNEEKTVAKVIQEVPRNIEGIDRVEVLVIDDGSSDDTRKTAQKAGADYVVSNPGNRGLAYSFKRGMENALKLKADIIVNIDADFQYNPREIPKLIQPVLNGKAEMVIGNRQVRNLAHMSIAKKYGNMFLSWALRKLLNNDASDGSSGFRAFSRECALRLNIYSPHTYTHETIIQCALQKMRIAEVPVEFRKREWGQSRLIRNLFDYVKSAGAAIIRAYFMYSPLKSFMKIGIVVALAGLFFEFRYLWFYFQGQGQGHIQSVILGLVLLIVAVQLAAMGFLGDIIDANRKREEEILYRLKKKEYER